MKNLSTVAVFITLTLVTLVLNACGGGSGGSGGGSSVVSNVEPGIYISTVDNKEFISVLVPAAMNSSLNANWYGLHFVNPNNPNLYSGNMSGISTASGSITSLNKYFSNEAVRLGNAIFNSTTTGNLGGTLTLSATNVLVGSAITFNSNAPTASSYNFTDAALFNSIAVTWAGGTLNHGSGQVASVNWTISNMGVLTAPIFDTDCVLASSNVTQSSSVNLFIVSLAFNNSTSCNFKGETLKGVAYILNNPAAGISKRLQIIAINPQGKGLTYRADI